MYVIVITRLSENLRLLFAGNWIRNCLYQYRTGWLNAWLWQVIAWGRKAPINSLKLDKITKSLTFSNEKAIRELGWKPTNVLENFNIE